MPIASHTSLTVFPPFDGPDDNPLQHDSPLEFTFDEPFDLESLAVKPEMAGAGSPFIKSEPNDYSYHQYNPHNSNHNTNMNSHHMHNNGMTHNGDQQMGNSNFNGFVPQNMSSSFNMGNAAIDDDELLDGIPMEDAHNGANFNQGHGQGQFRNGNMNQQHMVNTANMSMPMSMGHNMYSSTPEGAPIQSPFVNDFNYSQFRPQPQFSVPSSAAYMNGNLNAPHMHQMERNMSDSRSPQTPNTPAIATLHLGEPEYPATTMSQQPRAIIGAHRHSTSMNNWDSISNPHSWQDVSPFGSPNNPIMQQQHQQRQIAEVLKSTHHSKVASSLPTKMENGGVQNQEAKRKRRRESHNMVERRRRDNINERIQDLATIVPSHRLEDEKVRKHLQTNAPLSPSIVASGISPPQATSLLAGANGRRATTGSAATTGLPMDDKDKGPNKGDILNGSVAWTRDLLWFLKETLDENDQLKSTLQAQGQEWPSNMTEDKTRMNSEVRELLQKLVSTGNLYDYSRGHGTGLRVPGYTNIAGEPIQDGQYNSNNQSLSPAFQSGSSGISPAQFWSTDEPVFKEEDEFVINDL